MKILTMALALLGAMALAGCQVTAKIPAPVEVKVGGGGGHCPPGQAKKGRC